MSLGTSAVGQQIALIALFCGVSSGVFLKSIDSVPPGEAIAIRSALAFSALATIHVFRRGLRGILGRRGAVRAALDAIAGLAFALAIFEIPLSLLASIHATLPVVSAAMSAALLGDTMRPANWAALGLALCGALLILKPGLDLSPLGVALAALSTLAYALRDVVTRGLPPETDTFKIVLVSLALIGTSSTLVPSAIPWRYPAPLDFFFMVCAAVGFIGANFLIISALRRAPISLIAPLRYTSILWALVFDAALWGYVPDPVAWAGIALIAAGGIVQFSSRLRRPMP